MEKTILKILLTVTIFSIIISSCATGVIDYSTAEESERFRRILGEEAEYNYNGLFPDEIFIKTKTQTFNSYYAFQLYNGKIFYKGIDRAPSDWTILERTGLPRNFLEIGFIKPERITEISADSNELAALSDEGVFYHMMLTGGLSYSAFNWKQKQGWPEKTDLILDETVRNMRAWALGRRGSEVLWYEDVNGNQHHYGTIGIENRYFLLEDGQEIRMSDSGLPSDFSHNFLGPERGRFIAESISVSGNTIFLINAAGEMYTRLVDFDTVGSDPMFFKYTYNRNYKDARPGSDYDTNFNYWALPAEDWRSQPEIRLLGEAAITDCITIAQNGEGNAARELRVAGLNPAGDPGYYYKQVFDEKWLFKEAPLEIAGRLLSSKTGDERSRLRGPSPDKDYFGRLWRSGRMIEDIELSLKGFNIFEGSCTLTVSRGTEALDIIFHPVEMWYFMKRKSPGRDGSPKLFMVTLDIPEEDISELSPSFQDDINEYFSAYDLETFSLAAEAAEGWVIVESAGEDGDGIEMIFTEFPESLELNPSVLRQYYLLSSDEIVGTCFSDELHVQNPGELRESGRGVLLDKIYRNREFLEGVKNAVSEIKSMGFSSELSEKTYSGIENVLNFTGLYRIDYPKIYTVTMHSGNILRKIYESAARSQSERIWIYDNIITHTQKRINYYEALLDSSLVMPSVFAETPAEYFRKAGLDSAGQDGGSIFIDRNIRIDTSLMEKIPELMIINAGQNTAFLLEFIKYEEKITAFLNEKSSGMTELKLKARFTQIAVGDKRTHSEVYFIFDGRTINIEEEDGRTLLSFELLP
ncbi:MAG: hypothetical protein JEZ04_01865 [Spirochaetales bacterium]|nr:hypothetical protein [Spirochaetales bacterium]